MKQTKREQERNTKIAFLARLLSREINSAKTSFEMRGDSVDECDYLVRTLRAWGFK